MFKKYILALSIVFTLGFAEASAKKDYRKTIDETLNLADDVMGLADSFENWSKASEKSTARLEKCEKKVGTEKFEAHLWAFELDEEAIKGILAIVEDLETEGVVDLEAMVLEILTQTANGNVEITGTGNVQASDSTLDKIAATGLLDDLTIKDFVALNKVYRKHRSFIRSLSYDVADHIAKICP